MPAAEMTPEREEQLIVDLLRERAGIDPGYAGLLADLAAIGLVNGAWRNTSVEDWHAQGRLRDGDMLRVNSHTTWRVRQLDAPLGEGNRPGRRSADISSRWT